MKYLVLILPLFFLVACTEEEDSSPQASEPTETEPAGPTSAASPSPDLSEFAGKVAPDLVKLAEDELVPAVTALDGKDIIAVYYSAHWCPPCRAFTPDLSAFYDNATVDYPNFQLVFMSSDRSAEAMKEYMEWGQMNFPAVEFSEREASGLGALAARGIPYLVVLDSKGNQLLGKDEGETWKAPQTVLAELKDLLESRG